MLIQTSKEIIQELEKTGLKLTQEQKQIIISKVYDAVVLSYAEGKNTNGCDCGQVSCRICN